MARRPCPFKLGQKVWCRHCRKVKTVAYITYEKEWRMWFFYMQDEGHLETDLRAVRPRKKARMRADNGK